MADHGVVGTKTLNVQVAYFGSQLTRRSFIIGGSIPIPFNSRRDNVEGNPTPPSLYTERAMSIGPFFIPATAGAHLVKIDVKYRPNEAPRPLLVVKANAGAGVPNDLKAEAASSSGWVTITSPSFTVLGGNAVMEVYIETLHRDMITNWDNLRVE